MADTQRYWDGEQWSEHVVPMRAAAAPVQPSAAQVDANKTAFDAQQRQELSDNRLVIRAFTFPIGGFIGGARILQRRPWHGVGVMALSVVAVVAYITIITLIVNAVNGPGDLDERRVEGLVADWVDTQTDPALRTAVDCPSSMPIKTGAEYDCSVTDQDGNVVQVLVTVQDDDGNITWDWDR